MKIIKTIIYGCYHCPYEYNGKCFYDTKHKPIKMRGKFLPDWCPLEDYYENNN